MNKEFGANDVLMPFVMDYGNWIVWTFHTMNACKRSPLGDMKGAAAR